MAATRAASRARARAGVDLLKPVCVYGLCESNNVVVRFNDLTSMEGMYDGGNPARIHLSALRPLPRRAFNCAHELGHHIFGHGTTIDELRSERESQQPATPSERLANSFAASLLMPTAGLRRAFASRSDDIECPTPSVLYRVASCYGVGYATLVTHLSYGLEILPRVKAKELLKLSPKRLRHDFVRDDIDEVLVVVDEQWDAPTLDAEVGMRLLLPTDAVVTTGTLEPVSSTSVGVVVKVAKPGIARITRQRDDWAVFARVASANYVGLARYRHLEDEEA